MARRPNPWPARIAALAAILLAGYLAAGTLIAHRIMAATLTVGRTQLPPPTPGVLADPLAIGYVGDPETALGLAYEPLDVETELGPAPAWLIPGAAGRGDGRTAAVFVHGILGRRENGYAFVGDLHRAGVPVLLMTYRNDAEAPRDPGGLYAFGLSEWRDLEAAVALLQARGAERVIVMGASMGGGIVGQFLARSPRAGAVAALVLDSPALDFPAVLRALLGGIGLPLPGLVAEIALPVFARTGGLDLREARVLPVVAAFPGPVVLMHGAGDRIVPASIADALLVARRGGTIHVRSGADHLGTWPAMPEASAAAMRAMLVQIGLEP